MYGINCINNDGARVGRVNGGERGETPGTLTTVKKGIHVVNGRVISRGGGGAQLLCEAVDGDETGGGEWAVAGTTSAAAVEKHQPR